MAQLMKLTVLTAPVLAALALGGCTTDQASQPGASMGSMPMAMMSDKQMMDMCMAHMSQMTPEMMRQHMEMMREHHQMMDRDKKPQQPG